MADDKQTVHSNQQAKVVSMATYRGKVTETGQDVEVRVPRRSKRKKGWRMHVAWMDFDVSLRLEMTGSEYRVIYALASFIPERGGIEARCSQGEIAGLLGIAPQSVSQVMKALKTRRIIRSPRRNVYEITPWLLYNGDFASWNAEAEEWPEPIWRRDGADMETGVLT